MADDILLPELYKPEPVHRRRNRRRKINAGGHKKGYFFMFLIALAVAGVLFSFADIGGNIALSIAKNFLSKNFQIKLTAEKISGNPVRGYTLHNFALTDERTSRDIFSAGFLTGRINLPAVLTGNLRLSEISLGGISMDVEKFISAVQDLQLPESEHKNASAPSVSEGGSFGIAPAFAEEGGSESLPEIPIDRFTVKDSHFSSAYGVFDVNEIKADVKNLDIDVDGSINGLPLKGSIDMGESAGITAANKAELFLGKGKILMTGGLINNRLDIHASGEDFDLKEITALYPSVLKSQDFNGNADFTAEITGGTGSPKFTGSINYKGTKIYGYPVERASANLAYSDNRVSVSNIQASAFNIPVQGELAAAMRPNQPLSVMVKLDGTEANLNGLDEILSIPELKALSGKVSLFNVNISGPVNALSGLVNFNAPKITYDGRSLTNIRAQMKLAKSDTANVDGKFTFEGAAGYLSGKIASLLTNPDMNMTAKIAGLDIKRIESMIPDAPQYKLGGKITASVTVKGTASNPKVTGSLSSPEFSGWGQKITKPEVNFSFAGKTLTISKTEGTLNGMPVNLSGTISPLPSSNPNLNISATITMTPSALKAYVPDIDSYGLKGTVNAGLKIQGNADSPAVKLLAESPSLEAMKMITAKGLELTTALDGDLSKLEKISVNVSAKSLSASGVTFTGIKADVSKNGDSIKLSSLSAKSGEGTVTGSGNASVSGKSPLDFSFDFKNLALAQLAASSGIDLKGSLSGSLKVSGKNENPSVSLTADVPSLNAMGFTLKNLIAELSGNTDNITLKNVKANVEGAEVTAGGNIQITPSMKLNVTLNGNSINLEQLLKNYPAMKGKLSGTAGLTFNLTGNEKAVNGKGSLTSKSLKAFGIKMSDVNLPLSYSGNTFASRGGTAKLYGGTAKNTLTFDTASMKFTDEIAADGVDVNGLIQDVSGGLEGKVTGTGKLTFKVTGSAKDKVSYSGNGNFSMGSGAITGFKWLDLFTMIHKSNGLRYASVNAPMTLQTGKLIIKAGAIANANKNDALYRYAKLSRDGAVNFSGEKMTMDFMTESSVNYQLINAIQGGTKGGIESLLKGGVSGFGDSVKAFLSGGLTEAKKTASTGDFRTVTLRIHGKADSLSFSGFKISEPELKEQDKPQTNEQKPQQTQKQNLQDALKEKAKEALPDELKKALKIETPKNNTPQTQTQNKNQPQQNTRRNVEDVLKEELQKGLQKGLGELFKR
ncbi:MAG: hypothetical protein IJ697_02710 [Synergistaceae bacterium]|nr:hypothetical protein [Synergistaceae bacterium]